MKNIENFNRCTASVFAVLYSNFPIPMKLEFSDVPFDIFEEEDSYEEIEYKFAIYEATINWLVAAGYVNAKWVNEQAAAGVVLSAKGLEIMKMPSSLENSSPSFGEKIVDSIKGGAIDAAKSATKEAITKGLLLLHGVVLNA